MSAPLVRTPALRPTKLDRCKPLITERPGTYPELSAVRLFAEGCAAGGAASASVNGDRSPTRPPASEASARSN